MHLLRCASSHCKLYMYCFAHCVRALAIYSKLYQAIYFAIDKRDLFYHPRTDPSPRVCLFVQKIPGADCWGFLLLLFSSSTFSPLPLKLRSTWPTLNVARAPQKQGLPGSLEVAVFFFLLFWPSFVVKQYSFFSFFFFVWSCILTSFSANSSPFTLHSVSGYYLFSQAPLCSIKLWIYFC